MTVPRPAPRVADLFPTCSQRRTMRVAAEVELLTFDASDGSVVPIERLRPVLGSPYVGFEPGGQVELSLPCADSIADFDRQVRSALRSVRSAAASTGVLLQSEPIDRRGPGVVPLQLSSPRYLAMQEHFDRIGPAGRRMMRCTASTQVCLDWWPGEAGLQQWQLAQLAGPALAAVFATGDGSRLATWLAVDPSRTAFDGRLLGPDPVAAYADLAARAVPFVDPDAHLSTLFPPVRPRGTYLEVRYLDAQPDHQIAIVVAVLAALLYDREARADALSLFSGLGKTLADDWRTVALDPADGNLLDRGYALIDRAVRAMGRAPDGYVSAAIIDRVRGLLACAPMGVAS